MKHIVLTAFIALFTSATMLAQTDAFAQANEQYANGEYAQAISLYESIDPALVQPQMLYYNLANAYFKQGELGQSILFYERALRLDPLNKDIRHNLAFAQNKITDNIEPEQGFFIASWMRSLRLLLSENAWLTTSLICFLLVLGGALVFFFSPQMPVRKSAFIVALVALIFCISAVAFCATTHTENIERRDAIIMTGIVNAKSSPDKSGTDLFVLHEGTKVRIYDYVGEWVEIHVGSHIGWVPATTLERI